MRLLSRTLLLAVPLLVVGCSRERPAESATAGTEQVDSAASAPRVDPAAVRAEIESVNRQHAEALSRGDVPGFVQVYADDARILPPDMAAMEGRQSIEQFWTSGVQQLGISNVQLTTDEVEAFGDAAYEQGRYQFNTNQGVAQGKYIVIWKRTPQGWRWHRYIWNPTPSA